MDCFFNDKISIFVPASGIKSSRVDYDIFKQYPNLIITTLVGERDVLNSTDNICWELSRLNYPPDVEDSLDDWKRINIKNRDLKIKLLPITRSDSMGNANRSWLRWRGGKALVRIISKELEKLYPDLTFAVFTWSDALVELMAQAQYITDLEVEIPFYYTGGGNYRDNLMVSFKNWVEKIPDTISLKYSEKLSDGKPTIALKVGRVYHSQSTCEQEVYIYLGKYGNVIHNAWSWSHWVNDWGSNSITYNDYNYDRTDEHSHYVFLKVPARDILERVELQIKSNYIDFIQSFSELGIADGYYRGICLEAHHRKPRLIDLGIDAITGTSDKKDTFGREILLEYIRQEINFGRVDFLRSTLLYSLVPEAIKENDVIKKYLIRSAIGTIENTVNINREEIATNIEKKAKGSVTADEILKEWDKI